MGKNNQQRRRIKAKARRRVRSQAESSPGADTSSWSAAPTWEAASDEQPLDHRIRVLISTALDAQNGDPRQDFDAAVDQLVELSAGWSGRRAVLGTFGPILQDAVTRAWHGGWQPADVHRLAGRRLGTGDQALLGDAMASELSTYAAPTIDPRWSGQMQEADASVWWPADRTYLESRMQDERGCRPAMASALHVLHLLYSLPMLERLGPLPGAAAAPSRHPGSVHVDVDERILSRVRALLAKAESSTFEAEAETFTAGAQALMARHSIGAALLDATDDRRRTEPEGRRIGIDNPYEAPKATLLAAVANANRCRTVWTRALGFTTVLGFAGDLDAVETLFTSLLVQATRAMTREGSRKDRHGRSRTRAFRQSFLSAFAARIGERLSEVTRDETDAAAEAAVGTEGGGALIPLLAARSAAVDDAVEAMFPELTMMPLSWGSDAEGWHSGRSAADLAAIGSAQRVEHGA